MASAPAFVDRVVEFYTLRRASSAQEKLGPARPQIAELAELGRQRSNAAEALFAVGHTVEALELGLDALDALREAAERFGEATNAARPLAVPAKAPTPHASATPAPTDDGAAASDDAPGDAKATDANAAPSDAGASDSPRLDASSPGGSGASPGDASASQPDANAPLPDANASQPAKPDATEGPAVVAPEPAASEPAWRRALRAAPLSAGAIAACEETLARAEKTELPRLESGITPAHAALFREIMRARAALQTVVAPATLSRAEIGFTRGWRPLVTAVLVLGTAYGLFHALAPVEGTFVRVSSTWADSPDFAPERAIDGNDATMWLVPNGETGFLEVRFVPGRRVERVRLTNAGSPGVPDRGTNEYSLEIWVDGTVASSIDGSFADELGGHAEHEVGIGDVERIRFLIRSHYRISGGLAEMRWD